MSAAKAQASAALGVALGAVVEQGAGGGGSRRGVGEVVREHLVGVGTTGVVEVADGGGDDLVGEAHSVSSGGQVSSVARSRDQTLPTGTSATGIAIGAYPGRMTDAVAAGTLERLEREADAIVERPADEGVTLALLVQQHGEVVLERYGARPANLFETDPAPITAETPLISWSIAKSITHAALGILVGDGRIDPLDPAPVPEWQGTEKEAITLLDLAGDAVRAGVRRGLRRRRVVRRDRRCCSESAPTDHAAYAAAKPLLHPTGHGLELLVGHDQHRHPDHRRRPRRRPRRDAGRARGGDARLPRPAPVRPGRDDRRRPALRRRRQLGRLVVRVRPGPPVRPLRRAVPARRRASATSASCPPAGSTTAAPSSPTTRRPGFDYGRHWWMWPDQPGSIAAHGYEGQYVRRAAGPRRRRRPPRQDRRRGPRSPRGPTAPGHRGVVTTLAGRLVRRDGAVARWQCDRTISATTPTSPWRWRRASSRRSRATRRSRSSGRGSGPSA